MSEFIEGFTEEFEKQAKGYFDMPEFTRQVKEKSFLAVTPILGGSLAVATLPKLLGTNPNTAVMIGGSLGAAFGGASMLGGELARLRRTRMAQALPRKSILRNTLKNIR